MERKSQLTRRPEVSKFQIRSPFSANLSVVFVFAVGILVSLRGINENRRKRGI